MRLVLGSRHPNADGEFHVPGLTAPITIRRDKYGIACIEASNASDAMFGIGFAQGQDRAFQLETLRRVVRGTLAELVGKEGLGVDRMSRRIGFHRSAVEQTKALDADVLIALQAYCAGVNAGNTIGSTKSAHEFAILKSEPGAWEPSDVLGVLKLMSFSLPGNWDVELARLRMLQADGIDAVKALDPSFTPPPAPLPESERGSTAASSLTHDLDLFFQHVPRGGGSNNWLIAGARTASGKPILANDPHLGPHVPGPWYLVQVRTPEWALAGAALAGSPTVAIGHNGFAAWSVTAGLTDNTDLFLETLGPDGRSVRNSEGTFTPCEVVRETIHVKGGDDVVEEILVTPRGPVISPLLADCPEVVSLRAVWLDPLPLRGLFDAPQFRSFAQLQKAFEHWPCLPLNVLYADETGYQLVGQVPVRGLGHGMLPTRGDAPGAGWKGLVPASAMPSLRNPPKCYLATANSDPTDIAPAGAFLGADFIDAYRRTLIETELAKRDTLWDVRDCMKLQTNTRSGPWPEMRSAVLSIQAADADAKQALELLKSWDGYVDAGSPAAAVFELFVSEMCVRVAKAKAPNSWKLALGGEGSGPLAHNLFSDRRVAHLVNLLRTQPAGWFPSWTAEIEAALAAVVRKLRTEHGPGPQWWAWGACAACTSRTPFSASTG
jgi:penicillin amidase